MGEVIWDPVFTRWRKLNLTDLGKPYVEWKVESRGGDVGTTEAALLDSDIISMFMRDDEDLGISPEADKVEAFCGRITLRSFLAAPLGDRSAEPTALLDERHSDGGIVSRINAQGPLNAQQLYQALKEPRSRSSNIPSSNETEKGWHRRHTYVTDLNPWSICAVIGTGLRYQKPALRSMVYRHLQFQPRISVNIPPAGKRFELAFHLPYTPMRHSTTPKFDPRRFKDGQPLRRLQDVSFLNRRGSHTPIYRYEAQMSCTVVGKHDSVWDTFRFDDTYFETTGDGKRLVQVYDEQRMSGEESEDADGTRFAIDPSSRGRRGRLEESASESDPPVLDPRQFFLSVLRYDLEHVTLELMRNVDWINDSIRDYPNRQSEHDLNLNKRRSSRKVQGLRTIDWITKVNQLSKQSLEEVSVLIDTFQSFFDDHKALFKTDLCDPLVSQITAILKEWEKMKKTLESAVKQCQNLTEDQQFWVGLEALETGRKAQFISKFTYPVLIVTGIFSMEDHALPFKANRATVICMLLVISALIQLGYDPSWYWQVVLTVADKIGFTERFQAGPPGLGAMLGTEPAQSTPSDQLADPPARTFLRRGRDHTPPGSAGQVLGV